MTPPVLRKRSENSVPDIPSDAPSSACGTRLELKVATPLKAAVLDASRAPPAAMTKSGLLVEPTNRRMSPVWSTVVDAKIRMPSVEDAKTLKMALVARADGFNVVVPT